MLSVAYCYYCADCHFAECECDCVVMLSVNYAKCGYADLFLMFKFLN